MTTGTLARAAVHIATNGLKLVEGAEHQCFRVKNLHAEEVPLFVEAWVRESASAGLERVRLVVADDVGGKVDRAYVAADGNSITYYRNNNPHGLVYVETRSQSDEQGLQNIFSLRDSNFLDGSFDTFAAPHDCVATLLVSEAWRTITGAAHACPSLLKALVKSVILTIHLGIEPVPVRKFVLFAELVCSAWSEHAAAIDQSTAERLVGGCLYALDLFPDPKWRNGASEVRIRRRLELNTRHADLLDGSSDIEPEGIAKAAKQTKFLDESGQPLPKGDADAWRELCTAYARAPTPALRRRIPYTIFEQLFSRDTTGLKLGERIRAEIENSAPDRLEEYDSLGVTNGLNAKSGADATRLISEPGPLGKPRLVDLLSTSTRRSVERVAAPPRRRFFNPALEIVRIATRFREGSPDGVAHKIRIEATSSGHGVGLFAFLFGPILSSIRDAVQGVPGACELEVAESLLVPPSPPSLLGEGDEDEDGEASNTDSQDAEADAEVEWLPFQIRIHVFDENGQLLDLVDQLEWAPDAMQNFAFFWLLASASDSPVWSGLGALRIAIAAEDRDWQTSLTQRRISLLSLEPDEASMLVGSNALADQFIVCKQAFAASLRTLGLDIDLLQSHIDAWNALLKSAREQLVPDGIREVPLDALLGDGMLSIPGERRRLMHPLHPLRLRWISRYLTECRTMATTALQRTLEFAEGEGEHYLNWMDGLSPRDTPPIASGQDAEILFAKSETGWFEDYAPLSDGTPDLDFDAASVDTIAARISGHLDTHPYKRDGLSLLVVLPPSDNLPAEIVRRVAKGQHRAIRLAIHVAAPKTRWEAIARAVEGLSNDTELQPRTRLFPDWDLALIDFQSGDDLGIALNGQSYDVAVVTHLLHERLVCQQNTEPDSPRQGGFDPLHHRPLRLESNAGGGAISMVMLPRYPDPMLESWGTLVVRADRARPVAPSQPENIDFVELRINFQESARVFNALHESCHWVITLERHISRQQIESAEAGAPDVLSIEEGVGSNGLSTLVVSSKSGRTLVESRLRRRLAKLVPDAGGIADEHRDLRSLASAVYDEARKLTPHLTLQALGVARVSEEIVGLCIARTLADKFCQERPWLGLSVWLSLDEHAHWMGGKSQVRADMCRISMERTAAGILKVKVLVLEGKFRQAFDAHGVVQVERTVEFFNSILGHSNDHATRPIDSAMWREEVAAAIETVAAEAIRFHTPPSLADAFPSLRIQHEILSTFRAGSYELTDVTGLYSACLWDQDTKEISDEINKTVRIIRTSRHHVLDLLTEGPGTRSRPVIAARTHDDQVPASRDLPSQGESGIGSSREVHHPLVNKEREDIETSVGIAGETQVPGIPSPLPELQTPAETTDATCDDHVPTPARSKRMSPTDLRIIYEELLACFSVHQVLVYAADPADDPIVEGPASLLFKVRPAAGVDPRKLSEKGQALKLALRLEQEQNVSFGIDRGYVTIDVPKRPEFRYFVDAEDTWTRWSRTPNSLCVPIGEDRFGNVVELNFSSSNSPHLLVAGTTGSGKSEALNTILYGLIKHFSPAELRLMLIDPKGTELEPFKACPHLEGDIGWDDSDAIELLNLAVDEMQRRYQLFKERRCRSLVEFNAHVDPADRLPWKLVVLDEYGDLTHDPEGKKTLEAALKRLAQKARAAGIHLIIATQKPSAEVISTNLRANLPAQLALRVKSATESRVVMDEAGAENLNGKGDALLKADGKTTRIQCSRVSASGLQGLS